MAVKAPELFGVGMHQDQELPAFYVRNFSLFVLPFLAVFFAWKRSLAPLGRLWLAAPFVVAAAAINLMPFAPGGQHRGSWPRCTCPSRCGSSWATRTPPAAGAITTSA